MVAGMGFDVFALTTEWQPMVDDYRRAGSFEFYWQLNAAHNDREAELNARGIFSSLDDEEELLPYAKESKRFGNYGHATVRHYFDHVLTPKVKPKLLEPLRRALDLILPENGSRDDLADDADRPHDSDVLYAVRPAGVPEVLEALRNIDPGDHVWWATEQLGEAATWDDRYVPDFGAFEAALTLHEDWLHEAAAQRRGLVVVLSY